MFKKKKKRAPIRIASGRTSVSVAEDRSLMTIASVSLAKSAEPKTSKYLRKPLSIVPSCLAPRFPFGDTKILYYTCALARVGVKFRG